MTTSTHFTRMLTKPETQWKDTGFHSEHYYVVMAQNHKLEFVTWLWANGGFHCGHYYNDDEMKAWADYKERT